MKNKILHFFCSALPILLFTVSSHAQVMSGNGFIKGNFVEAGVRPNGAFGSSVSAPSDFVSATVSKYSGKVGFIADVGKDGWTVGTPKYIGDFFVPGTPYEAFSVKLNGSLYENSGTGTTQIPGSVTGFNSDGTTASVEWLGTINNLQVRQVTSVSKNSSFILIRVYLKNTGSSTINNIFYTRSVDPDNEVDQEGDFDTNNKIESQNPNGTSTALVSGTGKKYNSYLGLGSRDCRARVAIMKTFSSNGEEIYNGSGTSIALSAQNAGNGEDNAIAVAFKVGNLAAGDSTAIAMAYVLNAADLPPAMDETDPLFNVRADSYASGSLVNVCSSAAAELSIINGDGYTWTWSPSAGLDQTTGRTVHATLSGDIVYTASGVNTCGTTRTISLNLHPVFTPSPAPAGTITGISTVYKGWNVSFSVPEIENATFYKWTIPAGATFVSGYGTNNVVIKFGTSSSSGTVSVYGENSCGAGVPSTFNVTLSGASAPVAISSSNNGVAATTVFTAPTVVDDQISISGAVPITSTRVYIDNGFQNGDQLSYDGELPEGVTMAYSPSTGALSFSGSATTAQWQAIFRSVKFSSTSSNTSARSIKFVLGDKVSLNIAGKPHYYEYIKPATGPSWAEANTAASLRTFFGMAGYLATITSSAENDFIKAKLLGDGWVGGSDDYQQINAAKGTTYTMQSQTEGNWYWVTGPEAGTAISTGNNSPVVASGGYMNWAATEPNNTGNENSMQLYATQDGKWNDLSGVAGTVPGYVVEYGGFSSDAVLAIEYSRTVKSKPAAPVISSISDDTGPADYITSDKTIKIGGTAPSSSSVKVSRNGTVIGTVTADASGNWLFDYTGTTLSDGTYNFTATATVDGITSNASDVLVVKIDATAPSKPAKPSLQGTTENITADEKPAFARTAEPNATVTVIVDGSVIGTVVADADGNWEMTATAPLTEGSHSVKVRATDVAGNTSADSDAFSFTIDHTAPATPGAPVMTDGDGTLTTNNKPTIKGTTEENGTVSIYNNGILVTTVTADEDGNWSYTFGDALDDGSYEITTTTADKVGNSSDPSEALNITIDTQKPEAPAAPALESANNDGIVKMNNPSIGGTTEPNATVTIYDGETLVATVNADADGKWNYTFAGLTDGEHEINVTAKDAAGNTSDASAPLSITVDTTKPVAPPAPSLETENNGGNIKVNTPSIKGTAEPNSTVTIYDGGVIIATVTTDGNGDWSYNFSALPDGEHTISIRATDAAGNTSDQGGTLSIHVDTQAPEKPAKSELDGGNDGNINTSTPSVGGTTEPNATVTVFLNGTPVATVTADASGNWNYTFDPSLADGSYTVTTSATDAAGNVSATSEPLQIKVDTQNPTQPEASLDNGRNGIINTSTPTIGGEGEPGSVITIYNNGVPVGTATAGSDGKWSYTFNPSLNDGEYAIYTTATDKAGNTSAPSETFGITVDTQQPAAPSAPQLDNENNNGHVKTNKPTIKGNAEPGSTITVYDNGVPVATIVADENGKWQYTFDPELSDGQHTITTSVTDLAGNVSAAGVSYLINVDTDRPTVKIESVTSTAAMPFTVRIIFSEAVSGFGISGIQAENAKLSNFTAVSATEYTVKVSPVYDDKDVTVQVMQNVAQDASNNGNAPSNKLALKTVSLGIVQDVYPNPASNALHIVFSGVTPTKGRVMLVKMSGQRVYDEQVDFQNRTLTIDVSRFPSGQYVLVIKTNEHINRTNVMIVR